MEIDHIYLRQALDYDPDTGIFRWKKRPDWMFVSESMADHINEKRAGTIAGTLNPSGYIQFMIAGKLRYGHRLAWWYMTGEDSKYQIDHINFDKSDNSFNNLREVTHFKNNRHLPPKRSPVPAIGFNRYKNLWQIYYHVGKRLRHVGFYETRPEAEKVLKFY